MRFWVGVSAAFGAGGLIGVAIGILSVEDKLKKEYAESTASHWRMVQAVKIDAETPALDEESVTLQRRDPEGTSLEGGKLHSISLDKEPNAFGESLKIDEPLPVVETDVVTAPPQTDNPYHKAVTQTASVGAYASYAELSEEDFQEEDGRKKEQLVMQYHDGVPIFFLNGNEIDDALDRVGATIVDDMRKAVNDGVPFVWVRNNNTDTDYEVLFDQP